VVRDAHSELDKAVFAAYNWPTEVSDHEILTRLLELNALRPTKTRKQKKGKMAEKPKQAAHSSAL
jgi:hypothetical protein